MNTKTWQHCPRCDYTEVEGTYTVEHGEHGFWAGLLFGSIFGSIFGGIGAALWSLFGWFS